VPLASRLSFAVLTSPSLGAQQGADGVSASRWLTFFRRPDESLALRLTESKYPSLAGFLSYSDEFPALRLAVGECASLTYLLSLSDKVLTALDRR
jgi:hypothetical protein